MIGGGRAADSPATTVDDVARAVAIITGRVRLAHQRATQHTTCECGCLLLHAGETCPHCETPMPRTRTA